MRLLQTESDSLQSKVDEMGAYLSSGSGGTGSVCGDSIQGLVAGEGATSNDGFDRDVSRQECLRRTKSLTSST